MNYTINIIKKKKNKNVNSPKSKKSETITKETKEKNKLKQGKSKNKKSTSKNTKKNNKNKKSVTYWKKMEFKISQFSGKIIKNYKKINFPKNLNQDDIDIILKLITKQSKKFAPVRSSTKLTFIFIFLCLLFFVFGIFFIYKKLVFIGVVFIILSLILGFIYLHKIKKSIDNNYKKCHKSLFYLTDYINRKFLGKLGYYLLIDYKFRSIGIYLIPYHIWRILQLRDNNIELKQKLVGNRDTIDQLHKRESYDKSKNISNYRNSSFFNNNYYPVFNINPNYFSFAHNYNYNMNNDKDNDKDNADEPTLDEGENGNNNANTIVRHNIQYNNYFRKEETNNNITSENNEDTIININIKKRKILSDFKNEIKNRLIDKENRFTKLESEISGTGEKNTKRNDTKYEEMNSQINNRSIDKFNGYKFNGLGIINKNKYVQ